MFLCRFRVIFFISITFEAILMVFAGSFGIVIYYPPAPYDINPSHSGPQRKYLWTHYLSSKSLLLAFKLVKLKLGKGLPRRPRQIWVGLLTTATSFFLIRQTDGK